MRIQADSPLLVMHKLNGGESKDCPNLIFKNLHGLVLRITSQISDPEFKI